jgi:lactate dehydrogenase-like 2-hydroxyacid dehydrogenase
MTKPKVFVTRNIPESGTALIRYFCEADVWQDENPPDRDELVNRTVGIDGLLSALTEKVDDDLMEVAPNLKVISNFAVGVDNIDVASATRRKIPVGNTPDVLTDATADMAFALLLAAARRVVEGERYVKAGNWKTWNPQLLLGVDLVGSTLGIIGFGRIGQAVAKRAIGFGLRIIYHDPTQNPSYGAISVDLKTLLRESDFVSLHVPLTPETHHIINSGALMIMKPKSILVNTSRGSVIDPRALYLALKENKIFAAALDVTEPEPLPKDDPLLTLPNCIVVPHLGSASQHTRDQMAVLAAQNLIAGLKGERLPHCVNPEVYD